MTNWRDAPHFDLRIPYVSPSTCAGSWELDIRTRQPLPSDRESLSAHVLATDASPRALRNAVERLAYYFRREFRYDFVQYSADEHDPGAHAFLWTTRNYSNGIGHPVIGACCFRWRDYEDAPHGYAMQWIWFHPYARRQGHLRAAWPYFRQRFGAFHVEGPLSDAMTAFLHAVEPSLTTHSECARPASAHRE